MKKKKRTKDTHEWTKSGEIGVYAMLLRDVGYAVSVECTFCRLSSKRRKHTTSVTIKVTRWREKRIERWCELIAREAFHDSLRMNDDAIDGKAYMRIREESRHRE